MALDWVGWRWSHIWSLPALGGPCHLRRAPRAFMSDLPLSAGPGLKLSVLFPLLLLAERRNEGPTESEPFTPILGPSPPPMNRTLRKMSKKWNLQGSLLPWEGRDSQI